MALSVEDPLASDAPHVVDYREDEKNLVHSQVSEVEPLSLSQSHLIPPGGFDTHVHIFDTRLGPYSPTRAYTPATASLKDLLSFSSGVSSSSRPEKYVVVQPSPYGTDNRVLLSILRLCQESQVVVRGIAVVDLNTVTDAELRDLHDRGVRGLRLNLQSHGHDVDLVSLKDMLERGARRIQHLPGWKLQVFAPGHVWKDLFSTFVNLPVVVIADHTGGLLAPSKMVDHVQRSPTLQPGLEALVELAKRSRVLIKISGLYRSSTEAHTNFADMAPLVRHLATQVPDSLIWGSDWPHTGDGSDRVKKGDLNTVESFRAIDDVGILANIREWVGSEETWMKMMVHNPRRAFE